MKTLTLTALLLFAPVLVNAQTSQPDARDTLIEALEGALKARDEVIVELKVELGKATQKATDYEVVNLRLLALIDQLVKTHTKPKKFGVINF